MNVIVLLTLIMMSSEATSRTAESPETSAPAVSQASCDQLAARVRLRIINKPHRLLYLVITSVSQNPDCACAVVRAAILASRADAKTVAAIAGVAILAAPASYQLICSCAVEVAPDSIAEVKAIMSQVAPGAPLEFLVAPQPSDSPV